MGSIRRDSLWSRNSYKVMGETGTYVLKKNLTEQILITYIELHQGKIKIIQYLSLYVQRIKCSVSLETVCIIFQFAFCIS